MSFRHWVNNKWQEHVDELMDWERSVPSYSPAEYFRKYKWFLRREYRFEMGSR